MKIALQTAEVYITENLLLTLELQTFNEPASLTLFYVIKKILKHRTHFVSVFFSQDYV